MITGAAFKVLYNISIREEDVLNYVMNLKATSCKNFAGDFCIFKKLANTIATY